ncbi:SDR family oxidoreductase [Streptomyces sp. NPDC047061]|uniref:SDR family oxidoreductase n=1 Tax=Streptomyces sp. NPDC047061 TaxID=3154605 RepID=UPI0033C52168
MTQTILVTGTSSGLGRATARLFRSRGWNVVATMRDPGAERELTELDNVLVARLDVQDSASIDAAVDAAPTRFGRIDVLVNNAGYGAYGPLEATPLDKIRRQFDVNVFGLLATTKALLPHFRANRSGTIVNISSMGGRVTFPLGTLYHGSKFAVEGISEALQYELTEIGVRVKIVEPGNIRTDFGGRSFDFSNDPSLPEYQPMIEAVFSAFGSMTAQAPEPEIIAETVHQAVTDDTDTLRYVAGADAEHLLKARAGADDATFFAGMRAQFGLGATNA